MKIIDIVITVTIILIVIFIIYLYISNKKSLDQQQSNSKLKNIKKSENSENIIDSESEKKTYNQVQQIIIDVINNRFNYDYKLDKEEEKLLYPNYKAIADRIIQKALQYYDIYELKQLASRNAYDFVSGIPTVDSQYDKIVNGLQIAAIKYLIDKFPKIEPHIIIKYIKSYSNIFPISEAVYKDNKLHFNKEQMAIFNNFEKFLGSKKIKH